MTEVPAGRVVERLIAGEEDLSQFSTIELETAKMYVGLLETTLELELSQRYGTPIDIAEQEHMCLPVLEAPPNWRPTCTCGWKDRRLVPNERQAEYAWAGNHQAALKRG